MRLTNTAATLTVAGLAALVTGCSSSGSGASGPVVVHHPAKAAPAAAPVARPLNAKQQLAKAVRTSLAAHHVQFRYRWTQTLVNPKRGENLNPSETVAGVADFDKNLVSVNEFFSDDHANQPYSPDASVVVDGDKEYGGLTSSLLAQSSPWLADATPPGDAADVQVTQVLQDVKGAVRIVSHTANMTRYQLQANVSQLITDHVGGTGNTLAAGLAGTTQTEDVWVNHDGLIVRARWTIDPGTAHISGLDPSVVKALYRTIDFSNFGVDVVVPPHPTQLAAG